MSRTTMNYAIDKPDDFVQFVANDFFAKEGFRLVDYKGEQVWKHGTGVLVAPSFIKMQWCGGQLHLEAWIKSFGEHDLDGFYGSIPKGQLRLKVNALLALLYQQLPAVGVAPAPQPAYATPAGPDLSAPAALQPAYVPPAAAAEGHPQQGMPIPVAVHNPTGPAIVALVTGLLAIFGFLVPIVGVILGIVAICTGLRGRRSTYKGMATAGFVLGIVFLCLSALSWIYNIIYLLG